MKRLSIFVLFLLGIYVQLTAQCSNFSRPGIHVVQSGENLYRIAVRYNLTTYEIAQWNNMSPNATLYPCQELLLSDASDAYNAAPVENIFTERSPASYDTYGITHSANYATYAKQEGNKHTIQAGETIAGLANLYGYTEERFRKINLLQPSEELSIGSVILSTDCICNRVNTYDEINNRTSTTMYNPPASTSTNDQFYNRGNRGSYDSFYDNPQGTITSVGSYTNPPPAEPIPGQIRSANDYTSTTTPSNYGNMSGGSPMGVLSPAKATYMSNEELTMLDEINLLRSNPVGYIPYIEQYKRDIQSGKSFGSSLAVCDELIAELRQTPPLSILQPVPCLYAAAKKHGLDQKARGSTGHDGSDGSWPWDRVKRECSQMTDGNENLVGGPSNVREAVILLLVDDGIPSRGHRKTLLHKDWVYGATYKIGQVGYMPNCWVQKFGY